MSKYPNVWTLRQLFDSANSVSNEINGKWVPARPDGYPTLRSRFRCAWLVFTGKADAVIWPEDQEPQA